MKIKVKTVIEKELKYLVAYIPKYRIHEENFEDEAFIEALLRMYVSSEETGNTKNGFYSRNKGKDVLRLQIDIDNGQLINWTNGVAGEIYIKVVDEGLYRYLSSENEIIKEHDNWYVPPELQISDEGYGDYVCFKVDENGFIEDWHLGKYSIENRFLF